jgi:hypothetical protein
MYFLIDRDEGRERTRKHPLTYKHFFPLSIFKEEPFDKYNPHKARVVDTLTGDRFNNDDRSTIRVKCLLLSLTVPVLHTIAAFIDILDKLCLFMKTLRKLITYEDEDPIMKQVVDLIKITVQIVLAPVCVVLLEFSALYGLVCPYNGRKLFANLERFRYGSAALAECFQPTAFGDQVKGTELEPEAEFEIKVDLCGALAF